MKKLKKISIIVVAVLVVLLVLKNFIFKQAVIIGIKTVVGVDAKIDKFDLKTIGQKVSIKGFKLYNPEGFPKEVFIDIPEISVDYEMFSPLKGKIHINSVVFDLKEMVVVKNKEGKLNVDELKVAQHDKDQKDGKPEKAPKQMPMQIDMVTLNLGQVIVKDYTKGDPPLVKVYDIGVKDKVYKNLTSAEQLAAVLMMEAMGPTALKGAGIYGAASILGVAFLPAGVAGVVIGNDSGEAEYEASYDKVFSTVIETVNQMGRVSSQDKASGLIKAKVNGVSVTIVMEKNEEGNVDVEVSARKYMMPKPEIAKGIIHQISKKIK